MYSVVQGALSALAKIKGNEMYPYIYGEVLFYEVHGGTVVMASIKNLLDSNGFHGFHIHEGGSCEKMMQGGHFNPTNQAHPAHAGDLPPLLANRGNAFSTFYTNRFYPEDVIGKVVVIHAMPDDFKSQPSGNSGTILACGVIEEFVL